MKLNANIEKVTVCLVLFLVLVSAFFASCKKKGDEDPPVISISRPEVHSEYTVFDTMSVLAAISDASGIEDITVRLLDIDMKPVLPVMTFSGNNKLMYNLQSVIIISDIQIETGTYYLSVTASDGENLETDNVAIVIYEVPRKINGYMLAVSNSTYQTEILQVNKNFTLDTKGSYNFDFSGFAVDNVNQRAVLCGQTKGGLIAIDLIGSQVEWEIPFIDNPPYPYFTAMQEVNGMFYAGKYASSITGYNSEGENRWYAQTNPGFYPAVIAGCGDFVVIAENPVSAGDYRISTYYMSTGSMKQYTDMAYKPVAICQIDATHALISANSGVNAKLYLYSLEDNAMQDVKSFSSETILTTCRVSSRYFIVSTTSGTYQFDMASYSLIPKSTDSPTVMDYDDLNEQVIMGKGSSFKIYNREPWSLFYSAVTADPVLKIKVLYNK
ncbi:MAG: hypothetical protein KKA07_15130 [Bacteroidetes bacterium]|nr:hypothetical protein [Bacteroidota bacterium]MBU1720394.1 hypothetical protein [Bacteroidota bacterium]